MFTSMFLMSLCVILITCEDMKDTKLIIDNDAGGDDAMAIFMALLFEKYYDGPKLIGLTTGNGNTNEDNACTNNQKILKIAQRQDVPIYRGSKASIVTTPAARSKYGEDGLGDNADNVTGLLPAHKQSAVEALIENSHIHNGKLTVITIGTLTNVALAIKLDPDFLGRLAHLYIGAGHVHSEKHDEAEFNARTDAEAYHIVAQNASPDRVTILPFSQVKECLTFTKAWREEVLGKIDTDIIRAQNKFERVALQGSDDWGKLDPATVAIALRPDLVEEFRFSKNDIILCGDRRGINTNVFVRKDDANVRIVYSIKKEEYKQFLLHVFSAELEKVN